SSRCRRTSSPADAPRGRRRRRATRAACSRSTRASSRAARSARSPTDPAAMGRLDGKVAIVTGSGQGIGRGIAIVYARAGAHVVVAELKERRAQRTADEITREGGSALARTVDVSRREQVDAMVARTVERFGRVDVLV